MSKMLYRIKYNKYIIKIIKTLIKSNPFLRIQDYGLYNDDRLYIYVLLNINGNISMTSTDENYIDAETVTNSKLLKLMFNDILYEK